MRRFFAFYRLAHIDEVLIKASDRVRLRHDLLAGFVFFMNLVRRARRLLCPAGFFTPPFPVGERNTKQDQQGGSSLVSPARFGE
jgi:hypothetical protein